MRFEKYAIFVELTLQQFASSWNYAFSKNPFEKVCSLSSTEVATCNQLQAAGKYAFPKNAF